MKAIVCDTGPLLAVLNERDKLHATCVAFFDGCDSGLVVPSLIVTEVCYLAQTQVGPDAEARFLDSIVAGEVQIEHPTEQDWTRIVQLVRTYAGFPLGVADASVIATAERLGITQLATMDNRHMRAVKPVHCDAFEKPHVREGRSVTRENLQARVVCSHQGLHFLNYHCICAALVQNLGADGMQVLHIRADGEIETHRAAERRLLRLTGLAQPDLFRTEQEILAEAYERQEARIAHVAQQELEARVGA